MPAKTNSHEVANCIAYVLSESEYDFRSVAIGVRTTPLKECVETKPCLFDEDRPDDMVVAFNPIIDRETAMKAIRQVDRYLKSDAPTADETQLFGWDAVQEQAISLTLEKLTEVGPIKYASIADVEAASKVLPYDLLFYWPANISVEAKQHNLASLWDLLNIDGLPRCYQQTPFGLAAVTDMPCSEVIVLTI